MHLTGQHGTRPALPIVLGYLVLYLAAARLEDAVAGQAGVAPWSPRPGLTLVLLLLLGPRYAPLPLAAELAASLLLRAGQRPGAGWLLLDAAVVALAWTATAGLLGGRLRLDPALRRPRDLGRLLLVAAAAAPLLAAGPRVALAAAAGLVPWADVPAALASWWARDAAGVARCWRRASRRWPGWRCGAGWPAPRWRPRRPASSWRGC